MPAHRGDNQSFSQLNVHQGQDREERGAKTQRQSALVVLSQQTFLSCGISLCKAHGKSWDRSAGRDFISEPGGSSCSAQHTYLSRGLLTLITELTQPQMCSGSLNVQNCSRTECQAVIEHHTETRASLQPTSSTDLPVNTWK